MKRHFTNTELMALMDDLPDVTDYVERAREMTRSSMQHSRRVAAICKTPAGIGDFGADLCTMTVEPGMEVGFYRPRRAKRSKR